MVVYAVWRVLRRANVARSAQPLKAFPLTIALAIGAALVLQYGFGLSPQHAMGEKYLAPLWPVLCVTIAWAISAPPLGQWLAWGKITDPWTYQNFRIK